MHAQDHLVKARQDDQPPTAARNHLAADTAPHRQHGSHRLGMRLWTLLHAQSLLNGLDSGAHAAAFIEDDYRRGRMRGSGGGGLAS
jgi:hypothetical protein